MTSPIKWQEVGQGRAAPATLPWLLGGPEHPGVLLFSRNRGGKATGKNHVLIEPVSLPFVLIGGKFFPETPGKLASADSPQTELGHVAIALYKTLVAHCDHEKHSGLS